MRKQLLANDVFPILKVSVKIPSYSRYTSSEPSWHTTDPYNTLRLCKHIQLE